MLSVTDLCVSYGAISALSGISFTIEQGSIVTLIGGNGAGKTTTLRTISGLLRAKSGTVTFLGENISALPAHKIVARGLCHVPEGRMIFSNLTVDENLSMGAYLQTDQDLIAKNRDYVLSIFPRLISTIFEKIVEINKTHGITILLVEQNANLALEVSSYAYCLETGRIAMEGESKKLRADPQLKATYLGG